MIDTSKFIPKRSRWQDIFEHLKSKGYEVYPPGIKLGDCTSKYILVKTNGSAALNGISTDDYYYSVMCYVPKKRYSELDSFIFDVRMDMKELEPMIMPVGTTSSSFYDDSYKAHMVSIEYKNHKKQL